MRSVMAPSVWKLHKNKLPMHVGYQSSVSIPCFSGFRLERPDLQGERNSVHVCNLQNWDIDTLVWCVWVCMFVCMHMSVWASGRGYRVLTSPGNWETPWNDKIALAALEMSFNLILCPWKAWRAFIFHLYLCRRCNMSIYSIHVYIDLQDNQDLKFSMLFLTTSCRRQIWYIYYIPFPLEAVKEL